MRIPMVDLKKEYEIYGEPIKQAVLDVLGKRVLYPW
ncbi:hypothetical protein SAMN05428981_11242 [Bacillus sp. OV194]|nr:hypothetical protein SAMN05428981_11242 [Bacillus sp. OV194]